MNVRAKFRCNAVEDYGYSKKIKLAPVYQGPLGENEENRRFTQATPSGEFWMTVDNPNIDGFFKPGDEYYLDVTRAEKPA